MHVLPETTMNEHDEDLSTLAWVSVELQHSLEAAHKALHRYLRDAQACAGSDVDVADAAVLRTARVHLHQGVGALELVGMAAPARVLRAAEAAVQRIGSRPELATAAAVQAVEAASFAVLDYLHRLLARRPVSAVALYPQYRAVQELAGGDRVHPADLWAHRWHWESLPPEEGVAPREADGRALDELESLVLTLMRQPGGEAATHVSDLCAGLAAGARTPQAATTWRLASAFFQAQSCGLLDVDVHAKRMASRLLAQLRAHARGDEGVSERLAADLLFFAARSRAPGAGRAPRLQAVRQRWQLQEAGVPGDLETVRLGRFDPAVVAQARKRLAAAREVWSAVAGGEAWRLQGLAEPFALLADSLRRMLPAGEEAARALEEVAARTAAAGEPPATALAMEMATAVLWLDAVLEEAEFDQPELGERVRHVALRLRDALSGAPARPLEPWIEELYRRVSHHETMGSVVQELRASLAEVEKQIDTYFRDPAQHEVLAPVPAQLSAMRGVLSVLDLREAADALRHMGQVTDELARGERAAEPGEFDRLAESLGALGFLVDMLGVQPHLARTLFRFDASQGRLLATVPSRVRTAQDSGEAQALAAEAASIAQDAGSAGIDDEALAQRLETLAQRATVADQMAMARAAGQGLRGLTRAADASARLQARQEIARLLAERLGTSDLPELPPAAPAPAPAPVHAVAPAIPPAAETAVEPSPAPAPATGPEPESDEEMRDIFLEEAREVIGEGLDALRQLQAEPDAMPALSAVRRAFHTLKGSARMVGLRDYGEAAWACEQIYNARLAEDPRCDPVLWGFTERALSALKAWADDLGAGVPPADHWSALSAQAQALRAGPAFELPPVAAAEAPPPVPVQVPEPAPAFMPELFHEAEPELLPLPEVLPDLLPEWVPEPEPEPEPEAEPLPELMQRVPDLPSAADLELGPAEPVQEPSPEEEPVKVIGPLHVPIPLFNIFLNEADEQSRQLATLLAEWSLESEAQSVPEAALAFAHSLAGNSATVGYAGLSALARALEHALARSRALGCGRPGEAELFVEVADEIRRLLHQFAAGFLRDVPPALLQRLADHERWPAPPPAEPPAEPPPEWRVEPPQAPIELADALDTDLLPIFEEEADELLPQLQARLRDWAAQPADRDAAAACMRTLHTFKGGARLAGALRLGEMAHRMETTIQAMLAGPELAPAEVDALHLQLDALIAEFESVTLRAHGLPPAALPAPAQPTVVTAVEAPAEPAVEAFAVPVQTPVQTPVAAPEQMPAEAAPPIDWARFAAPAAPAPAEAAAASAGAAAGLVRVRAGLLDRMVNGAGEITIARARIESDVRQLQSALSDLTLSLERMRRELRDVEVQAETQIGARLEAARSSSQGFDPLELDRYTRLQELTRMMAESVNDVATLQRGLQRTLQSTEDQLAVQARQTRELQEDLLRTRMVEFDSQAERLHRVVRQTARDAGRMARLDIVGGSIEIDRSVLERMIGPFEHMLRNSVVHGIEPPEVRGAAGKDPTGVVTMRVTQVGNEVGVEIHDDGAGLDLSAIRRRAVECGLLAADAQPGDAGLAHLIMAPGFSTAREVTELAGRGVGMDVVRTEVNALGGRIEIVTEAGRGTTLRLVLPLTTAVNQVVMLRAGRRTVAVPATLIESVRRVPNDEISRALDSGRLAVEGEPVPFFWLGALLEEGGSPRLEGRAQAVAVVRSAAQRVALLIDEVMGHQEVVVKNLGPQLSRMPGLTGVTVLPSGEITLIYNPVALISLYGERLIAQRSLEADDARARAAAAPAVLAPLVLVVDDSLTVRRITQRLLQREGYRVVVARDGLEALERMAQELPSVMLCDIEMPRMDGFELLRTMRDDPLRRDIPVVMITSRLAPKHRDHATELGVRDYLGKPYPEAELLALVARFTGRAPAAVRQRADDAGDAQRDFTTA